jgi:competence protein ComEC
MLPRNPAKKHLPLPALWAAAGAACAFYGFPLAGEHWAAVSLPAFLALLASLLSLLLVFESAPGLFSGAGLTPRKARELRILLVTLGLGVFTGTAARLSVPLPVRFGLPPEKVTAVQGKLASDPRLTSGGGQTAVLLEVGAAWGGGVRAAPGGVRPGEPLALFFPAEFGDSLSRAGRGSEVYAEGRVVQGREGPLFRAVSAHVVKNAQENERARSRVRLALLDKFRGPVWGGLAQALLLGARDNLDGELTAAFRDSGCAHVLALSGMHLALLCGLLARLLKKPFGVRGAAAAGAVFVLLYVYLAGEQASLVRAAIMSLLGGAAAFACVRAGTKPLLCLAFLAQIVFRGGEGLSVSFILSYLALAGILWLGAPAGELLKGRLPPVLAEGLSASLGAFLATAGAAAFFFGALRPIGIVAGLAVAALAALFILLALAALAVSFVLPAAFPPFDAALTLLYTALQRLVNLAARVPGIPAANPALALLVSLALAAALLLLSRRAETARLRAASFA